MASMSDFPRLLVNGQPGTQVSVLDRGLAYGDGVFRTLAIVGGQTRWWAAHLAALARDCQRLGLTCPDQACLEEDLVRLGPLPDQGVLRITVTRGEAPRGYAPRGKGTRILACWAAAQPAYPVAGLNLRLCNLRLAQQPALAGVKHLNRLENVLARGEWDDPSIHEGVLLDGEGRVVSGVMSNLFIWSTASGLRTPRLDRCGVAGVARERLLNLALVHGIPVETGDFCLAELLAAEEVLLCNSLMGLRRVARLGERTWSDPVISHRLLELFDA